jgi:hypothetical protein
VRRLIVLLALVACAPASAAELEAVGQFQGYAAELEVAGNLAFLVDDGAVIVSIADPMRPKQLAKIDCSGTADVALDPAAQILVLAVDSGSGCVGGGGGIAVFDIRDPADPKQLSEASMPAGAHTVTMDGRILYANQPDDTGEGPVRQLEIFDLSNPEQPRQVNVTQFTVHGPHESSVRHRPDGRTLLYTANGLGGAQAASVLDVTDPARATMLQTIDAPAVNYAHQAEVSFDDKVILLSDELLVGSSYGGCGRPAPGAPGHGGGLHLYAAAPDGTFGAELATWNVPATVSGADQCTIHNFMQAPDARRMLVTWYSQGTRLLDFSDPANVQELAAIVPEGGLARGAIAHNGLIYTGDYNRGMDVLRFRGSGWPATAGPAEAVRFGSLPAPASPLPLVAAPAMPPPPQPAGRTSLRLKLRRAARLAVLDARGVQVATLRVPRGRSRVFVIAVPGRYRWIARAGRRRVGRGVLRIRRAVRGETLPSGTVVSLYR